MPISTAARRRAASAVGVDYYHPSVSPNVAKDSIWRQQAAQSYASSAVAPPPSAPELTQISIRARETRLLIR
jgi:hypothetical protein